MILKCRVCGRPVPPRNGTRGRTKEVHRTCSDVDSRLHQLHGLIQKLRFGDTEHVRLLRGELFNIVNHSLRADLVTIDSNDDTDD